MQKVKVLFSFIDSISKREVAGGDVGTLKYSPVFFKQSFLTKIVPGFLVVKN